MNSRTIHEIFFVDATTLLGTNRKLESEDSDSGENKKPKKLTQNDFKTIYVSKITPEKSNTLDEKESKSKLLNLPNDHYDVVDTSYVYVKIKEK